MVNTGSFGNWVSGASDTTTAANNNYGTYFVLPYAGSISSITAMLSNDTSNTYAQCGVYEYGTGSALKGTTGSAAVNTSGGAVQNINFNFATPLGLEVGSYTLCMNGKNFLHFKYSAGTDRSASIADTFPISVADWTGGDASFTDDLIYTIHGSYDYVVITPQSITDSVTISDSFTTSKGTKIVELSISDNVKAKEIFFKKNPPQKNIGYASIEVDSVVYEVDSMNVNKSLDDYNSTSSFTATLINYMGRYKDVFNLNDEVVIYLNYNDPTPAEKIFRGKVESISFDGKGEDEVITLTGRDYGSVMMDIIVSPRVFKNMRADEIIVALMNQNANNLGITLNNVNLSSTMIDKITFNNISLFDALSQVSELAGFYFYIDNDKDLHFEENDSIDTYETFDNTNIISASFSNTDSDIFNNVYVFGDRQLTGVQEVFSGGAITGSVYTLDDKPSNVVVTGSPNTILTPGGILGVSETNQSPKWLVDYDNKQVILTSGTSYGFNTGWVGSGVYIDYQRSSPVVSVKSDQNSITTYGRKDKRIVDTNIKTLAEAQLKATSYLSEHKDLTITGTIKTRGILNITPGNTATINIPFQNINNQTYMILNANYNINKKTLLSDTFLTLTLNKKVRNFLDMIKEQEMRLRKLEGASADTNITEILLASGSISVEAPSYNCISRSIGSAFYFGVNNHNIFNSDSSLFGDVRAGSVVVSYP